jgi:hypothetical protein
MHDNPAKAGFFFGRCPRGWTGAAPRPAGAQPAGSAIGSIS